MELEGNLMSGIRLSTDASPHDCPHDGSPLRLNGGSRPKADNPALRESRHYCPNCGIVFLALNDSTEHGGSLQILQIPRSRRLRPVDSTLLDRISPGFPIQVKEAWPVQAEKRTVPPVLVAPATTDVWHNEDRCRSQSGAMRHAGLSSVVFPRPPRPWGHAGSGSLS